MIHCTQVEDILGNVIAYMRVIEFQKIVFPHAHCICFLDNASKDNLINPEYLDTMISAEIPAESYQEL